MLPHRHDRSQPHQPREVCNEKALDNLAASIKDDGGIIQPVVVRPKDDKRYELVAGHRRWLAASHLAMNTIPAIIRPLDNKDAAYCSLIDRKFTTEDLN